MQYHTSFINAAFAWRPQYASTRKAALYSLLFRLKHQRFSSREFCECILTFMCGTVNSTAPSDVEASTQHWQQIIKDCHAVSLSHFALKAILVSRENCFVTAPRKMHASMHRCIHACTMHVPCFRCCRRSPWCTDCYLSWRCHTLHPHQHKICLPVHHMPVEKFQRDSNCDVVFVSIKENKVLRTLFHA